MTGVRGWLQTTAPLVGRLQLYRFSLSVPWLLFSPLRGNITTAVDLLFLTTLRWQLYRSMSRTDSEGSLPRTYSYENEPYHSDSSFCFWFALFV
jgi:hypothetical protein